MASFPDISAVHSIKTEWHPESVFTDISDITAPDEEGLTEAKKNQRAFEYARGAWTEHHDLMQEWAEFYHGAHWTPEQEEALLARGQAPVVIQASYQLIEQLVDSLTANTPSFRATPVEDSDVQLADAWSDLLAHIWYVSDGQMQLRDYIRDSCVQGLGYAFAYIDPNADAGRGEAKWRTLEPKSVYVDPASTHHLADDAAFILVRTPVTYQQLYEIDPEAAQRIRASKEGVIMGSQVSFKKSKTDYHNGIVHPDDIGDHFSRSRYEVLERYEKVRVPYIRLFNPTTGKDEVFQADLLPQKLAETAFIVTYEGGVVQITTDPAEIAELEKMYERLGPQHHIMVDPQTGQETQMRGAPDPSNPNVKPNSHVILTPSTREVLMEMELLPLPSEYKEVRIKLVMSCGDEMIGQPMMLPTSHYPVVPLHSSRNRTPMPTSHIGRVRDLQDIINKSLSLILAHAANSTNMKVFYPDGSIVDVDEMEQNWGKAGTAFIPYDPAYNSGAGAGGITIASPPPLPTALYANLDRAYATMERILGVYAFGEGNATAAPDTFRGILMLDEMGNRRAKGTMDNVYSSLTRLGQVLADYAQAHYTEEKIIRLLAPSGDVKETIINYDSPDELVGKVNDISSGRVDIRILSGSTMFNNRFARQQTDLEMFDRGIIDDIALLKNSDYPDANEILQRKSMYSQLQSALQQYEQELKKAQGDLQTADREVKNKAVRIEVEKAKAKLATLLAKVQSDANSFNTKLEETNRRAEAVAKERLRAIERQAKQQQQQPEQPQQQ